MRVVLAALLTILAAVPPAAAQSLVERGRYLVEVIGACGNCHSPIWTDAQIVAAIYGVKANGQPILPPMPWPYYAGRIAAADLKAMIAYLRSLPPIRNAVPPSEPPKR